MSSRSDHPTHATGAHQAHDDGRRVVPSLPERYAPHLDGLFTYCLSVLCEHDAATAVLGEVLAVAERHHGRRPPDAALYRSWLYALARWACLRRLSDRAPDGGTDHGTGVPAEPAAPPAGAGTAPATNQGVTTFGMGASAAFGAPAAPGGTPDAARRRRELASLAWPEAAGTTPEQREALELSVRHRLSTEEVAAVLGGDLTATRTLLAAASCEVERTRAALAVVEFGRCPDVAQLAGDHQMLLGGALRRELVRHVDDCAECRRTAERATAHGPWPGTAPLGHGALPMVTAPRTAVCTAMAAARGSRSGRAEGVAGAGVPPRSGRTGRSAGVNGSPRYDRRGFPVRPKDPATRRRARTRAVTTTVLATVLVAPVLALWAAYRGAPSTGEGEGPAVTAGEADGSGALDGAPYENAGSARTSAGPPAASGLPAVSVQVVGADGMPLRPGEPDRSRTGPGRLTVTARPSGAGTVITLTASGGEPVHWTARSGAPWLRLSGTAGVLVPGESGTLVVTVDHGREPDGYWNARITLAPGGTTVTLEGWGAGGDHRPGPGGHPPEPGPGHHPGPRPASPAPDPTHHPTASPTPSSAPTPAPTAGEPTTGPSPSPSGTAGPAG
ncbi:sigma-70 family RNA polymerase sigma factor [Streptomyces albofaciens JCM 4342]|uniref:sigma-70 family RNA polymerase sigma factor n=1 Tax=Streptomyces albofaciens TaxID=66866 RepID=UPI00123BB8A4|nr:sigma-70 family RNA polymerase sigma factor [Streptomyces albofaciens]KAA6214726.1 sigma-70 family RNA polymerase sigma factor [Streptomyces albofaciens JCM 4342]